MEYLGKKWPVLILVIIATLAVVLVFFYPSFLNKIFNPEKPTKFTIQDNSKTIPAEFPKELLFDLKEIKDSKTTDYINKGEVTAKQYEITYTSSRPLAELVTMAETYFIINNFSPIYKEETDGGEIQTRRAVQQGKTSLVIQIQKLDAKTSEVRVIYTK